MSPYGITSRNELKELTLYVLNYFEEIRKLNLYFLSLLKMRTNGKKMTHLSYIGMIADTEDVTPGARVSAAIVLTYFSPNIPASAKGVLIW